MAEDALDHASLALAGVVLCAGLVDDCAHGRALPDAQLALVKSAIHTRNAHSLAAVFPRPEQLLPGVETAIALLRGEAGAPAVLTYSLHLIDLANRLRADSDVLERLAEGLDRLGANAPDAELSALYQRTISTLGRRIQVRGDPQVLARDEAANEIRGLLLAGIRFAWLWIQLGGRRWRLILQRKPQLLALERLRDALRRARTVH